MHAQLTRRTLSLLALSVAVVGLTGCLHAPMFNGAEQRDCVERALQSSASLEDATLARQTMERACGLGDASACGVLGVLYEHGRSGRVDLAGAERAYDRACSLGDTRACAHTARLLIGSADPEVRRDSERALERYCDLGESVACMALVERLPQSGGSPASAGRAMGVLWRACDQGDALACLGVGDRLATQAGQEAVAREHWLRACALGSEQGCRRHVEPAPRRDGVALLEPAGASPD